MRKSSILMAISAFILIFSLAYMAIDAYKSNFFYSPRAQPLAPVIDQLMAIDLNQKEVFTPELILTGQLPILVIHQSNDPHDHTKDLITFLDQVGRLTNFDYNNDDRIDTNDPIFGRIEVAYIKNGKITGFIPLAEVGIRQINLDKAHMKAEELYPNGPKGYWNVANIAILADGSKRGIRVVPVTASAVPKVPAYS